MRTGFFVITLVLLVSIAFAQGFIRDNAAFAVWKNALKGDEYDKSLNSEYALSRANQRLTLWDNIWMEKKFRGMGARPGILLTGGCQIRPNFS
jgi:hypothetical protein